MEGVVVSVAAGAMKSLLTKLTNLVEKRYKLSKGLKKEIKLLRDDMSSMDALLVTLSGMEELNEQQKEWRDKVRELSYDVEDCIDIFTKNIDNSNAGVLKKFKARFSIGKRIKELKSRIDEASNSHQRYRLDVSQPYHVKIDPQMLALSTANLVGTDRARDTIIGWLVDGVNQVQPRWRRPCFESWNFARFLQACWYYFVLVYNFFKPPLKPIISKETKVVSIVGIGGVGKTALANQVYTMVKRQFDCTAFVSASRSPNMVKILSDILSEVSSSDTKVTGDLHKLRGLLKEDLKNKRYLIVIDDVWTKGITGIIQSCLPENNCGSRVVITTRIEDIARARHPLFVHVYKMEPLNDLDSRKLFNRRISGSEDACPEQLEDVSRQIGKKCGGLPLAILSFASTLASRHPHEIENMKEVWEDLRFQFERNPDFECMIHVLNLGYNDLSLDLKTCMLYLGIFPEDSRISKDSLLRRWVAEGFVTVKHGSCPEKIAEYYFNELINRNMIQVADIDDCGHVFSCRVHDVMLGFIILKCREENFVTIIDAQQQGMKGSLEVRRLSLQIRNSERSTEGLGNMELGQVRSLNFWGPAKCLPSLPKFLLLRVVHLDVSDSKNEQCDLSTIGKFFQLRYLKIRGMDNKKLRQWQLCKLRNLKTLEILPRTSMEIDVDDLPLELWHLVVPSTVTLIGSIDRMRALRTLEQLKIHISNDLESNIKGLGNLTNLRELTLSLSRYSSRRSDVGDFLLSSLCRLVSLESLIIHGSPVNVDVLVSCHPPPFHLHRLHALVCPFSKVPEDWITQLRNLRSLEIKVVSLTRNCCPGVLGKLTSLVHLRLHVQKHAPEEGVVIQRAEFPNLKEFWFAYQVPCLTFEGGAMPNLQKLTIQCYANAVRRADDGVFRGIEHLGSLKSFCFDIVDYASQLQLHSAVTVNLEKASGQVPSWDKELLEAAFRRAINKHPGSLDIRFRTMYSACYCGEKPCHYEF